MFKGKKNIMKESIVQINFSIKPFSRETKSKKLLMCRYKCKFKVCFNQRNKTFFDFKEYPFQNNYLVSFNQFWRTSWFWRKEIIFLKLEIRSGINFSKICRNSLKTAISLTKISPVKIIHEMRTETSCFSTEVLLFLCHYRWQKVQKMVFLPSMKAQ